MAKSRHRVARVAHARLTLLDGRRAAPDGLKRLSVKVEVGPDGKLPTAVRLFAAGWNTTEQGDCLFDAQAAELVMAAYHKHGVLVMVDLEHLSVAAKAITGDARNFDPDARGRGALELRSGELWFTQIKWTPDGEDRLRTGKQTYLSPAFADDDDGRIVKLYNIALTAMPATDYAPALVAASATRRNEAMTPKQLLELVKLRRDGKSPDEALKLLSIDLKTLQAMGKLLGVEAGADLGALMAAVITFAEELQSPNQQEPPPEPEPAAEPTALTEGAAADDDEKKKDDAALMRAGAEGLQQLRSASDKMATELALLRKEREDRDTAERHKLVASLVTCRKFVPADVWADDEAKKPQAWLVNMPLEQLGAMAKRAGATAVPGAAPTPPAVEGAIVIEDINVSPFELARVKRQADLHKVDHDVAIARYIEVKGQQITGAELKQNRQLCRMLSRPLTEQDVVTNEMGRLTRKNLVTLSTPVKPIEEFGASSQRALEEFRLEHNTALASQAATWAESISPPLPAGSLKDTYPISFAVSKYIEKVSETGAAKTSNNKDITVSKKLYHEAEECELVRLVKGDFAYIQAWNQKAARMARARQFLRNHLVVTLLEANGTWVDGAAFFATTHKVDPFNAARQFRGSATWSNLQDSAAPLDSPALTAEKNLFLYGTPGPDGEELGYECDALLFPTSLNETAKNLLTVQELILSGVLGADGSGTMGQVRNPHFQSGMGMTRSPELAGTDATANYYLLSLAAIATGLVPWVLSEDPDEEVVIWDENSDFYKNGTGFIKYESRVRVSVVLLYPHGIRRINGT